MNFGHQKHQKLILVGYAHVQSGSHKLTWCRTLCIRLFTHVYSMGAAKLAPGLVRQKRRWDYTTGAKAPHVVTGMSDVSCFPSNFSWTSPHLQTFVPFFLQYFDVFTLCWFPALCTSHPVRDRPQRGTSLAPWQKNLCAICILKSNLHGNWDLAVLLWEACPKKLFSLILKSWSSVSVLRSPSADTSHKPSLFCTSKRSCSPFQQPANMCFMRCSRSRLPLRITSSTV